MEIYIELILEKLNKDNVYRSTFDFKNKIQLISMIAGYMVSTTGNNTPIKYTEFYNVIDGYLKNKVGFDYDTLIIVNYLFDRRIFVLNNHNEVKFSYMCFFHFFVAKRMEDNLEFKTYILDKSRYHNFPKEIDYYTGLVRSDKEVFILIFDRFKELFEPMSFILDKINPDDYFNIQKSKTKNQAETEEDEAPLARNIEIAKIKENRPDDEAFEQIYDDQLDKISYQKQERKDIEKISFDRMMLLMCNILRNLEGVEDLELKKEAYEEVIKHNITYSILYTQMVIRYIIDNGKLPPSIPSNVSLEDILKNMPYHIQHSLYSHLGTQKLSGIIKSKMNNDYSKSSISEIEKFLSVGLYADIQGSEFDFYLKRLINTSKTVPVQNYLLLKLMHYLYKRSRDGSDNEKMYLELISDLHIKTQKYPKRLKEKLMKDLKEAKDRVIKFFGN